MQIRGHEGLRDVRPVPAQHARGSIIRTRGQLDYTRRRDHRGSRFPHAEPRRDADAAHFAAQAAAAAFHRHPSRAGRISVSRLDGSRRGGHPLARSRVPEEKGQNRTM